MALGGGHAHQSSSSCIEAESKESQEKKEGTFSTNWNIQNGSNTKSNEDEVTWILLAIFITMLHCHI